MLQQGGGDPHEGPSDEEAQSADSRTERSLEESRKLILEWADELHHVDKVRTWQQKYYSVLFFWNGYGCERNINVNLLILCPQFLKEMPSALESEENKKKGFKEEPQMRIMEWAKELQTASEVRDINPEEHPKKTCRKVFSVC